MTRKPNHPLEESYQFTGAELDPATGLYHMGARFYEPLMGRWLSEDPVQDRYSQPVSLNFYAYVANNPLVLVDPTGMKEDPGTLDLVRVNEERQNIVKRLLELAGGSVEKVAEILRGVVT